MHHKATPPVTTSFMFRYVIASFLMVQAIIILRFHLFDSFSLAQSHRQAMSPPQSMHEMNQQLNLIQRRFSRNSERPLLRQDHPSSFENHGPVLVADQAETTRAAQAYAQSFTKLGRGPLNFFHIPKTAGTAVEEAAAQHDIPWGSCRFSHKPKRQICPYPNGAEWPRNVGWWHLPPYVFPLAGSNPYQSSDLFAIVRSPYERMVSEFYYICTLKIKDWRPDQCDNRTRLYDEDYMNMWLQRKLQERQSQTAAGLLADNGHFTPQSEFLVGPHQVRVVDHVLHMDDPKEDLSVQFKRLMKAYNMPESMELPFKASIGAVTGAGARNATQHLGVDNLHPETVGLIHHHYGIDFAQLRYSRKK